MLKFMHKRRGAISIFLLIVLLPMMMVSAIFVDESRIKLAESVATSAGDLTLNTALTNYDTVLKEMYGLFATSQDMEELYSNLENYYRKSIVAAGVAETDADDYVSQIMEFLKSEAGTDDLLKMNLTEFTVSQEDNGNLANAAMLKNQVVEFMKYRAPLGIGMDFMNALQSMKNLSKQTKLIEDKNSYYEEQNVIVNSLQSAWTEIQMYQFVGSEWRQNRAVEADFPNNSDNYFSTMTNDLNAQRGALEQAAEESVKYLHFDVNKLGLNSSTVDFDEGNEEDVWDDKWTFQWFGETETIRMTDSDMPTSVSDVLDSIRTVRAAKAQIETRKTQEFYSKLKNINSGNKSDCELMYIVSLYNDEGRDGYSKAIYDYVKALADLKEQLYRYGADEAENVFVYSNGDGTFRELEENESSDISLYSVYDSYWKDVLSGNDIGDSEINQYNWLMSSLYNKVGSDTALKDKYHSYESSVKAKLTDAGNTIRPYYDFISDRITNLTTAISILNTVKTSVSPGGNYDTKLNTWSSSANNLGDDTLAQNDKVEISKQKEQFKPEEFQTFINKLEDAKASLEAQKVQLENYKILGNKWTDIPEDPGPKYIYDSLSAAQKGSISSCDSNGDYSYSSIVNEAKGTITTGSLKTSYNDGNENPDLSKPTTRLYTYMHNNYKDDNFDYSQKKSAKAENKKEKENELKNKKDVLKARADEYEAKNPTGSFKTTGRNISLYKNFLPSKITSTAAADVGSVDTNPDNMKANQSNNISDLLGTVIDGAGSMATDFRDNLYVTNYVMEMFTYDTYEAETTKKNGGDLGAFSAWYEAGEGGTYTAKSEYSKYAEQALSLTKNKITPDNHYLYGSEVEYIIYGGNTPFSSCSKAYGTIYLIRFAFNTIYAFQDVEIKGIATSMATALFGVPPLTPLIPLAKIAITLGFSIAESTYDLYQLKKGEAVPLIKRSDTFVMKPTNALAAANTALVDVAVNTAEEKLNSLLDKTDEELEKWINDNGTELKDITDKVTNSITEKYTNYAKEITDQLVIAINNINLSESSEAGADTGYTPAKGEKVKQQLTEWVNGKTGTDEILKEIYQNALNVVVDNGYIKQMFDAMKETATSTITDVNSIINTKVNEIMTSINNVIQAKIDVLQTTVGSKIHEFSIKCKAELEAAAKEGAAKLKDTLVTKINETFGDSSLGKDAANNTVANFTSWSYSNYLSLFLMISLYANEQEVICRMADVIQLNMEQYDKKFPTGSADNGAFLLKNSTTHIKIEATIEVKPLMMTLPFMADTTKSQLTGTKWYTVKYSGTAGY